MTQPTDSGRRRFLAATAGIVGVAATTGGQTQVPAGMHADPVSVRDFGARGDGQSDDTAAIQSAIDSIAGRGGTVVFPAGRYLITRTLRVRSLNPIALVGTMFGQVFNAANGPALLIGQAMDYVIEYAAPDPANRGAHGAGMVSGLAFVDPSTPNNAAPGRWRVIAALHLKDFALGLVDSCTFHWIRGSAIRTEFAVMTTIRGCRIRYCGDAKGADVGAIRLGGSEPGVTTQSFLLDDTRIEACYTDPYLAVTDDCHDVTIRACGFEAAPPELPATSRSFLDIDCQRYRIESCNFNRTGAVAVRMRGRGVMLGCQFANASGAATTLELSGDRCMVANCLFEDNRTALSLDCSGGQNQIAGNMFYYSGGAKLSGRGNVFSGNHVVAPKMRGPGYWLDLSGNGMAQDNRFDGNGGVVGVGAISTRVAERVTNNAFDRWPGQPCIRRGSPASLIEGNSFTDVSRPMADGSVP